MHYRLPFTLFIVVFTTQVTLQATPAISRATSKKISTNKIIKQPKKSLLDAEPAPFVVSNIHIRVLLHEQSSIPVDSFFVESTQGFILENSLDNGKKGVWKDTKINLIVKNNTLYVECKDRQYRRVTNNNLTISPVKDIIHLNKKTYHGKITIRIDNHRQKLMIINRLNLDDYIFSVLRNEMLSYWPMEIQKVQAIASRTYALHHMRHVRSRNPQSFYDIKNTNSHQVYGGSHECVHLRKAVSETHNLILTYDNNIALTMFDICCGGIVPAGMSIKDDDKPYLFRKNKCTFCENSSSYKWHYTYKIDDIMTAVREYSCKPRECAKMGKLREVFVDKKDAAGIVRKVGLVGSKKKVVLTMQDFKRCLSASGLKIPKSYAFKISQATHGVKCAGLGYGHNIGLCQIGARELVKRGWSYKNILGFYYPGTMLARLKCD